MAKKYTEGDIMGTIAGAGTLCFMASVFLQTAEQFIIWTFMWISGAVLWGMYAHNQNKEFEYGIKKAEKRRNRDEAERRRKYNERKRKQAELKRRQAADQKVKNLDHAKWLVEEGGIDNINKAIRIFKKYEK
jgi:hypothetical protein